MQKYLQPIKEPKINQILIMAEMAEMDQEFTENSDLEFLTKF